MNAMKYSSWKSTATVLHLVSQMLGKFKLEKMASQPEWQQVTLPLDARGFTTGLVPCGNNECTITIDIFDSTVTTLCTDGRQSSFKLTESGSIADYYESFQKMLKDVDIEVSLNPAPQEMNVTTPFDEDTEPRHYDATEAQEAFKMFVFAYRVILDYVAGFRCKSALPELFWGTFDVTGVLYSGKSAPFPGEGIIEKVAFDEELIEYGFWPGDEASDEPSFFVLPYPFVEEDLSHTLSEGSRGYYSQEKAEYFLTLENALSSEDPYQEIMDFFEETFEALTHVGHWDEKEWYVSPLLA